MEEMLIQYGAMGAVLVWFMYRFEGKITKLEDKMEKLDNTLDRLTNVLSGAFGRPVQDVPVQQVPVAQFTKKTGVM